MPKEFTPKILTANDLFEGDVVYRAPDGSWTRHVSMAHLYTDAAASDAALAVAEGQSSQIVGAYLAEAKEAPTGPLPVHFREAFRARGPSNYAHGKQAEHGDV